MITRVLGKGTFVSSSNRLIDQVHVIYVYVLLPLFSCTLHNTIENCQKAIEKWKKWSSLREHLAIERTRGSTRVSSIPDQTSELISLDGLAVCRFPKASRFSAARASPERLPHAPTNRAYNLKNLTHARCSQRGGCAFHFVNAHPSFE